MKGEVASQWASLPLAALCTEIRYGYTASAEFAGTHRFVRITDIDERGQLKNVGLKFVSPSNSDAEKFAIHDGDLLIARSGSVGRAFVARNVERAVFASYLIRFRLDTTLIDPRFAFYFCYSPSYAEAVRAAARGAAIKNVNAEMLGEIPVPVPSIPEQRRVVSRVRELLDRVEEVRALRSEVRNDVGRLFSSGLSSLFCVSWPTRRLEEIAQDIRNGWSGKELHSAPAVRVLRLSSVHTLTIDPAESREVRVRPTDSATFCIRRGDVFVVRGNGSKHLVGRSAIVTDESADLIFNDLLIRVIPEPSVMLPEFLNYCLHTSAVRRQIEESAKTAAGIWKINQRALGNLRIPCPSLHTQSRVVQRARSLHERCRSLMGGMESCIAERLSSAVLRKAFAGEL